MKASLLPMGSVSKHDERRVRFKREDLLLVGRLKPLQHWVLLDVERFQLGIPSFSCGGQDGVSQSDTV